MLPTLPPRIRSSPALAPTSVSVFMQVVITSLQFIWAEAAAVS